MSKLECPACRAPLRLSVAYTGTDWDTVAGEGSGYDWPVSLECTDDRCGRIYTIGHVRREKDFAPLKEDRSCLAKRKGEDGR